MVYMYIYSFHSYMLKQFDVVIPKNTGSLGVNF